MTFPFLYKYIYQLPNPSNTLVHLRASYIISRKMIKLFNHKYTNRGDLFCFIHIGTKAQIMTRSKITHSCIASSLNTTFR
mmetsp:Transcript_20534/g.43100  ORF Transcript_20534/g.43100 Transcript_20534/m.43100 type:complete len:80 (+) Transcript_20534:41-280(+)